MSLLNRILGETEHQTPTVVWQNIKIKGLYQNISSHSPGMYRTKVPGGWLVMVTVECAGTCTEQPGLTFYSDPQHTWDGSSL
jgi:hypothetical protein